MTPQTQCNPDQIQAVLKEMEGDEAHLRANWTLHPPAARFVYLLTRIGGFKSVLEVGTSIGFSTLHFAWAAAENGGTVSTIDADPGRQNEARENLRRAGLENVTFHTGDALATLAALKAEGRRFDLMFLDARKSEYVDYLRYAEDLLGPGGVLLADNTQSHREDMRDFVEAVNGSPLWFTADLDLATGMILARRK